MFRRSLLAVPLLALPLLTVAGCASNQPRPAAKTTVVFFTPDSAALDQNAQAAITQAADFAQEHPNAIIHVRGFAGPDAGSPLFNSALSHTRAVAVADALANTGIPRGRILMEARGAVPYDLMPTESRRVEIFVGP